MFVWHYLRDAFPLEVKMERDAKKSLCKPHWSPHTRDWANTCKSAWWMKPLLMNATLARAAGQLAVIRTAVRCTKRSSHANTSLNFNNKTTTTTTTKKTNGICWNETDTGWGSEGVELRQRGGAHDTKGEEHNHVFQDLTCWYSCGLGAEFSIIVWIMKIIGSFSFI